MRFLASLRMITRVKKLPSSISFVCSLCHRSSRRRNAHERLYVDLLWCLIHQKYDEDCYKAKLNGKDVHLIHSVGPDLRVGEPSRDEALAVLTHACEWKNLLAPHICLLVYLLVGLRACTCVVVWEVDA